MSDALQAWKDRVDDYWYGLLPVVGENVGFVASSCNCCGSLAGERYAVTYTAIDWEDEGEDEVCVECAHYIANGETPEYL